MSASILWRPYRPITGNNFPAGAPERFWKTLCKVADADDNCETLILDPQYHLKTLRLMVETGTEQWAKELIAVIQTLEEVGAIEIWREY